MQKLPSRKFTLFQTLIFTVVNSQTTAVKVVEQSNVPDAIRLPKNKLWFGYPITPYKSAEEKNKVWWLLVDIIWLFKLVDGVEKPPMFQGQGQSLRK